MTKNNNQMFIWGAVGLVVVAIVITIVVVMMKRKNNNDDGMSGGSPFANIMAPFASEPSTSTTDSPMGDGTSTYYTSPTPGGSPGSSPMSNDDDDIMYPM